MPVIKRPVRPGKILNPQIHADRRVAKERREKQAGNLIQDTRHLEERIISMPEAMFDKLAKPKPEMRVRYQQLAVKPIPELQMHGYTSVPGKDIVQFLDRRKNKRRK